MLVHPWDAALDETEWRAWLQDGHDFGQLAVNGAAGDPPMVVPTHFVLDGAEVLVHLARPNPVWPLLERNPQVVLTVVDDYAYVPSVWRADQTSPDGVPTSYYATVQLTCHADVVDDPEQKRALLRSQLAHFGDPADLDRPAYRRLLPGIRGMRLRIESVRAKFKYDDRKAPAHRSEVADRLDARDTGRDTAAARQQRRRLAATREWRAESQDR
jgi:transcriptional regulator